MDPLKNKLIPIPKEVGETLYFNFMDSVIMELAKEGIIFSNTELDHLLKKSVSLSDFVSMVQSSPVVINPDAPKKFIFSAGAIFNNIFSLHRNVEKEFLDKEGGVTTYNYLRAKELSNKAKNLFTIPGFTDDQNLRLKVDTLNHNTAYSALMFTIAANPSVFIQIYLHCCREKLGLGTLGNSSITPETIKNKLFSAVSSNQIASPFDLYEFFYTGNKSGFRELSLTPLKGFFSLSNNFKDLSIRSLIDFKIIVEKLLYKFSDPKDFEYTEITNDSNILQNPLNITVDISNIASPSDVDFWWALSLNTVSLDHEILNAEMPKTLLKFPGDYVTTTTENIFSSIRRVIFKNQLAEYRHSKVKDIISKDALMYKSRSAMNALALSSNSFVENNTLPVGAYINEREQFDGIINNPIFAQGYLSSLSPLDITRSRGLFNGILVELNNPKTIMVGDTQKHKFSCLEFNWQDLSLIDAYSDNSKRPLITSFINKRSVKSMLNEPSNDDRRFSQQIVNKDGIVKATLERVCLTQNNLKVKTSCRTSRANSLSGYQEMKNIYAVRINDFCVFYGPTSDKRSVGVGYSTKDFVPEAESIKEKFYQKADKIVIGQLKEITSQGKFKTTTGDLFYGCRPLGVDDLKELYKQVRNNEN